MEALAQSFAPVDGHRQGIVVVDARTGRIVGANPRAVELVGQPLPSLFEDLVTSGVLARPDYDLLVRHGADPRGTASWRADVRVHGGPVPVELSVIGSTLENPTIGARAVVAMLYPRGHEQVEVEWEMPADAPGVLQFIYDRDMRILWADPRLRTLNIDPESFIGTIAWMQVHPEDIPIALPKVNEVLTGRAEAADYTIRVASPVIGNWVPARVEIRRMVGAGDVTLLVNVEPLSEFRRTIYPGLLTERELAVVSELFNGRRVKQIAALAGLSVKTVRNQLSAVFRKLDVRDQTELLDTYHRPPRTELRTH